MIGRRSVILQKPVLHKNTLKLTNNGNYTYTIVTTQWFSHDYIEECRVHFKYSDDGYTMTNLGIATLIIDTREHIVL